MSVPLPLAALSEVPVCERCRWPLFGAIRNCPTCGHALSAAEVDAARATPPPMLACRRCGEERPLIERFDWTVKFIAGEIDDREPPAPRRQARAERGMRETHETLGDLMRTLPRPSPRPPAASPDQEARERQVELLQKLVRLCASGPVEAAYPAACRSCGDPDPAGLAALIAAMEAS